MAKAMDVTFDYSDFENKMNGVQSKLSAGLMMRAEASATELQSYMQTNRPWTDRTGEAKRQLRAQASSPSKHSIMITLSHGVNYGIWLELAHEKKYAILAQTAKLKSSEVFKNYKEIIKQVLK